MIKINQEYISVINTYEPKIKAPKYLKEILTEQKEEDESNTIIIGGLNIPFSTLDRSLIRKQQTWTTL